MTLIFDQDSNPTFVIKADSDLPIIQKPLKAPTARSIYYSDVNSAIKQDGKALVLYDADAINKQINNILSTPLGTDDFEPTFGSLLPYRIHDNITDRTAWLIRNDTIEAIRLWMGNRITVDQTQSAVEVLGEEYDNDGYLVNVVYTINWSNVSARYSVALIR